MNLATLLDGPATILHRNQRLHFRGGLTLRPLAELFDISTDLGGVISRRALENAIVLTGTPDGEFTTGILGMTHRWQNPAIGQLVTPRYDVETVTHGTDTIALLGAPTIRAGCPVMWSIFPGSTTPTGYVHGTVYYWGVSGKLYTTEANAIADDGATGLVTISDNGTGDFALIEQEYLQIDAITANRRITLHNAAVVQMPPIILSAIQTVFGQMTFGCFLKNNAAWADANSLYTVAKVALTDTPSDPDDIPTVEYSCAFGAAPWDSFKSRGPVTITPSLATEAVSTDGKGNVGLKIAGLNVAATLSPEGFSQAQMLDLLAMQGGTVARGKSRVRADLVVAGTGVHATVYNGSPRELPQTFQVTGPLAGELAIDGAFKSGSGFFRLATAAP
jgi:hypothetical protein